MARSTSIGFVKVRAATNTCGKLAFHARVSFDEAPHAVSEPWRYRVYHRSGLSLLSDLAYVRHLNWFLICNYPHLSYIPKSLSISVWLKKNLGKTQWTCWTARIQDFIVYNDLDRNYPRWGQHLPFHSAQRGSPPLGNCPTR
jgi:hypothetical protein